MKIFRSVNALFVMFVVGIIVPAGILTYVGFRSFRYEDQLLDRLTEDRYIALADEVSRVWQQQLEGMVATVNTVAQQQLLPTAEAEKILPALVQSRKVDDVPVRTWLIYSREGTVRFPIRNDGVAVVPVQGVDWGPFADRIRALEQLEFSQGNLAAAAQGYAELLKTDLSALQRRELLKMLGAAEKRRGKLRETEVAYRQLAAEFDQVIDASGLPTGVVARQLLLSAYEKFQATTQSHATRVELFTSMLAWRWSVSSEVRERVLGESDPHLPASTALRNAIDGQARIARLFDTNSASNMRAALRTRGWWDAGGVVDSPEGVAVSILIPEGTGPFAGGRLVALLDRGVFWSRQPGPVLGKIHGSSATVTALLPTGAVQWGETLKKGIQLERTVRAIEPPIRFTLHAPNSGRLEIALRRRRIFGGMMGLSAVVIVAGLALMFRAIRKERENAELKAEFVANVSHELKTPLSTILYIGERLSAGRYQPHESGRFFTLLNREAVRLKSLIEDVLDFSRMMSGHHAFRTVPVDMRDVVRDACARMAEPAQSGGFDLQVDVPEEPLLLKIDPSATIQAVVNLIDNAMKYSGASRCIRVVARRDANEIGTSVEDFGIGIAREDHARIFQRFVRVEPAIAREHAGGVGLGLAMVKAIVEGQGGRIELQSEQGKGSIFTMRFPRIL